MDVAKMAAETIGVDAAAGADLGRAAARSA